MNLAAPYAAICPGLEGPVLEVLSRTTSSMTGRQVARLARHGSQRGILEALNRLAEHGLVTVRRVGGATLYELNREHVAVPAVERMLEMRSTLLDRVRALLSGWSASPVHVSLFGSAARGDGDTGSDVDLLVVRPEEVPEEDPVWREQMADLASRVEGWSGNRASLIEVEPRQLADFLAGEGPVAHGVLQDAVTLAGPRVDRVAASSRRRPRR